MPRPPAKLTAEQIDARDCGCENPRCNGRVDQLREYLGYRIDGENGGEVSAWTELVSHCSHEQIVRWVNELARNKERQKFFHKRNNLRAKLLREMAGKLLDPDELQQLNRHASERAAETIEGNEGKKNNG